jgi:glycosyltransferase involved in cell wall biosynthesis
MDHTLGLTKLANRPHSMSPGTLRIAFATPEFVTERHFDGGLANYLNRVSRMLADAGHEVHVVTLSSEDGADFEHAGVRVHRVKLGPGWQSVNWLTRYRLSTTCHWLNLSVQMYRKLRELHRRDPFHVIQYPNYSSCGLFSIPLLRAAHVVRASSYQPALNDAAGLTRSIDIALAEKLEVLQYKLARSAYAPSQALQTLLAGKAAMPRVQLVRSPFYVETRDWDTSIYDKYLEGRRYVLYFGRFQLHKGVHVLAQALPRFLERHPDAHAVFVGRDMETPLSSSMAAFARAQCGPSASRLVLIDNLPHRQLYPIVAAARLVVLPSLVDNLPNACLEAMGLGAPVIGTAGVSFDELITDGVNGFLVPPNDPEGLSEKMMSAWVDPRLEEIGGAAKRRMADFAPEKTITALLAYYSEVMSH